MSLKHLVQNNRGDTIVEVMVVLAVLSLAIGISYSTASRSLLDSRQANQNSQASSLLQSQVESLRTLVGNPSTDTAGYIFRTGPNPDFCIDSSGNVATTSLATPSSSCAFDVFGNAIGTQILISYTPSSNPGITGGTFILNATWPNIDGQGVDTATVSYRLYANEND